MNLSNSKYQSKKIFNTMNCREEIKECDKHEIIVKISDILGNRPEDISKAEKIFDQMRYNIARYIYQHEYDTLNNYNGPLALWLEEKASPGGIKQLSEFIKKYLK